MADVRLDLLASGGIRAFPAASDIQTLADDLDAISATKGNSAALFLSESLAAICDLWFNHSEAGGLRNDFLTELDDLFVGAGRESFDNPARMRDLRDQILLMIATYRPY